MPRVDEFSDIKFLMRRAHFSASSVVCEAARMFQLELASSHGMNRTLA